MAYDMLMTQCFKPPEDFAESLNNPVMEQKTNKSSRSSISILSIYLPISLLLAHTGEVSSAWSNYPNDSIIHLVTDAPAALVTVNGTVTMRGESQR